MSVYLGIDPGLTGALAIIRETPSGDVITLHDTPTVEVAGKTRVTRLPDASGITSILMREVGRNAEVSVCIEKVSAAPIGISRRGVQPCNVCGRGAQPGATSSFNFGYGFGVWIGIFTALQLPYSEVHPRTWKSAVCRGMDSGKDSSIWRARELYPECGDLLKLKKHHGRSDALLIAHYGRYYFYPSPAPSPYPDSEPYPEPSP